MSADMDRPVRKSRWRSRPGLRDSLDRAALGGPDAIVELSALELRAPPLQSIDPIATRFRGAGLREPCRFRTQLLALTTQTAMDRESESDSTRAAIAENCLAIRDDMFL